MIDWGTDEKLLCFQCSKTLNNVVYNDLLASTFHHCPHIEAACIAFNNAEKKRYRGDMKGVIIAVSLLILCLGYFLGRLV